MEVELPGYAGDEADVVFVVDDILNTELKVQH